MAYVHFLPLELKILMERLSLKRSISKRFFKKRKKDKKGIVCVYLFLHMFLICAP